MTIKDNVAAAMVELKKELAAGGNLTVAGVDAQIHAVTDSIQAQVTENTDALQEIANAFPTV